MNRILLVGIAATMLVATAPAQGRNRGQNAQDRIQQRAGSVVQNALELQAKQFDPLELIYRQDVQKDLKLDLGQRNKLDNLHDQQVREIAEAVRQNRRNRNGALAEPQEKARAETQAKIDELLTPEQKARLKQISLQLMGNRALFMSDVQAKVEITEPQKAQLTAIEAQQSAKINQLQTQVARRQVRSDDLPAMLDTINKETDDSIAAVLSDAQKKSLQSLFGEKFKADR